MTTEYCLYSAKDHAFCLYTYRVDRLISQTNSKRGHIECHVWFDKLEDALASLRQLIDGGDYHVDADTGEFFSNFKLITITDNSDASGYYYVAKSNEDSGTLTKQELLDEFDIATDPYFGY